MTHMQMIYTKIVIDMETLDVLEREGFEYYGPIAACKGDSTAQSAESSQSNFSNQLQQAFQTNNAAQQNQLNFLNGKLQSAINNPQGYSPATLAAMRAQATDQTAGAVQNAERSVNTFADKGGSGLPSGVAAQLNAQVASQAGQAENNAQQQITEQNANLQNQNLWKATQAEEGVAGLENPDAMASAENGSAGQVANLSNAVTSSAGPTFGSILGGVVGAGLGVAGKMATGGMGGGNLPADSASTGGY